MSRPFSRFVPALYRKDDSDWLEVLKVCGTGLALAFGIRTFIAEVRYIPSISMKPTLQVNDRVLIEKVSYHFTSPKRYDIVVMKPTDALLKLNVHDALIKRIIGLPGEQIQVKHGKVYVNHQPLKEDYVADQPAYAWGAKTIPPNSYLVLGDNRNYSFDGHNWGFVPSGNIIGQAVLRFYPFNRINLLKK